MNIMKLLSRIKHGIGKLSYYYIRTDTSKLGYYGDGAALGLPADLKKPKNVYLYENARLGPFSTILTPENSRFIMKRNSGAAEHLTVVASNHRQKIGTWRNGNELNECSDVIVDENVWLGINVTLLFGVHIGREAIIGACSVVTKSIPPYAVAVGNPARVVKFKWSVEEIIEHEKIIYSPESRFSREELLAHRDCLNNQCCK